MRDDAIDREIIDYVTDGGDAPVPQRCTKTSLEKRGWLGYIRNRFPDITSDGGVKEALYRLRAGIETAPVCLTCGKSVPFRNGAYPSFCCPKCRNSHPDVKRKNAVSVSESLKKAYGERGEQIKAKRTETFREKYGVESPSAFSVKEFREKAESAVLEKYGVRNVMELPIYHTGAKEKSRAASVRLWKERGYDISYTDRDTVVIRNGCPTHGDVELDVRTFVNRMKPERRGVSALCPQCHPIGDLSGQEREMCEFLNSLSVRYVKNDRTVIKPLELDFYIPSRGLAIEMNGVYYHSVSSGKDKGYHARKADLCESKGIQLLQIWETDWIRKNDLVRSMIAARLGIYRAAVNARDCEIAEISPDDFRDFLSENHLQGPVNASVRLGLIYREEIVSVIGFGRMRAAVGAAHDDTVCELYRFCSKSGYIVRGGASRLFSHAADILKAKGYKTVLTYAKRDWSNGRLYSDVLGFTPAGVTAPGYFWANSHGAVCGRYASRKSEIALTEEEKTMSETQIMTSRGYVKCYDSGNLIYRFNLI